MGYRGGELADLAGPLERGVRGFARRTTEKVGEDLRKRVRRHTPVAKMDASIRASYDSMGHWISARAGRVPGTLKESWQVGEVEVVVEGSGERFRIPVYTLDQVAPYVEWETRPHLIVPRKPGGVLTIPTRTGMVFATLVHHPGTRGAHMMATAIQEVAIEWQRIADREWRAEVRGFWARNAA